MVKRFGRRTQNQLFTSPSICFKNQAGNSRIPKKKANYQAQANSQGISKASFGNNPKEAYSISQSLFPAAYHVGIHFTAYCWFRKNRHSERTLYPTTRVAWSFTSVTSFMIRCCLAGSKRFTKLTGLSNGGFISSVTLSRYPFCSM